MSTYKYNDKTQLTPHFNVSEFRCKCGGTHDTQLDTALVDKLEKLYTALNCSKIIVNSGYRCSAHDRNVGGNGYGQHTKGTAADIVCYGSNGKPISSKIVSCVAQNLGFGGIANIDRTYTATHVDVRSGSKWYGDETVNNNTVTSNFYTYYGISKSEMSKYTNKIETSPADGTVPTSNAVESAQKFDKSLAGQYKVTATALNVRTGSGTNKPIMVTIPTGFTVRNYGYYNELSGEKWLYIQFSYKGKTYTGFASGSWLAKSQD